MLQLKTQIKNYTTLTHGKKLIQLYKMLTNFKRATMNLKKNLIGNIY